MSGCVGTSLIEPTYSVRHYAYNCPVTTEIKRVGRRNIELMFNKDRVYFSKEAYDAISKKIEECLFEILDDRLIVKLQRNIQDVVNVYWEDGVSDVPFDDYYCFVQRKED